MRLPLHYRVCLNYPFLILAVVLTLCGLALYHARDFTFDASADTLISKGDPELAFFRKVSDRFGDAPFLVLTYTPIEGPLLVPQHIARMKILESALLDLDGVKSVKSILDAPLLKSPRMPLTDLANGFNSLRRDGAVDLALAIEELTSSPLFKELLISVDGRTTMFRVDLREDRELEDVRRQREDLGRESELSPEEATALSELDNRYIKLKEQFKARRESLIFDIRAIRDEMSGDVKIFLGGVPMVAADIISFVRSDMMVLSVAVFAIMAVSLWVFFRRLRWVLIPLGTTSATILLMIGLLGFLDQPATAISSNFLPLLAIITISFTIHLIARYRHYRRRRRQIQM